MAFNLPSAPLKTSSFAIGFVDAVEVDRNAVGDVAAEPTVIVDVVIIFVVVVSVVLVDVVVLKATGSTRMASILIVPASEASSLTNDLVEFSISWMKDLDLSFAATWLADEPAGTMIRP